MLYVYIIIVSIIIGLLRNGKLSINSISLFNSGWNNLSGAKKSKICSRLQFLYDNFLLHCSSIGSLV